MDILEVHWRDFDEQGRYQIVQLVLNKPHKANALDAEMLTRISESLTQIMGDSRYAFLRAVFLQGRGKHFCAGADLSWMKKAAQLGDDENHQDARQLSQMFALFNQLDVPLIGLAQGAVYGGGVGLLAVCDWVIGFDNLRLSLSEMKLGLIPAVITPYLMRKLSNTNLCRLALTAAVVKAEEAMAYGLIQKLCSRDQLPDVLQQELEFLMQTGPQAVRNFKHLLRNLQEERSQEKQREITVKAIADVRKQQEAQQGLHAFFSQESPPWLLRPREQLAKELLEVYI